MTSRLDGPYLLLLAPLLLFLMQASCYRSYGNFLEEFYSFVGGAAAKPANSWKGRRW